MSIKKIVPSKYHGIIRYVINYLSYFHYMIYDYSGVSAFGRQEGHISKIIRYTHRVEKALAKENFAPGRGYRAVNDLLRSIQKANLNSQEDFMQVSVAFNVLDQFFKVNCDEDSEASRLFKFLYSSNRYDNTYKGGVVSITQDFFAKNVRGSFEDLAYSRYSIRYFSGEPVDRSVVRKALEISAKTPSVCNRQAWFTWHVSKKELVDYFKEVHSGFSLNEQLLTDYLVICMDRKYFSYPLERNQAYIDGGLYSMSIMYALTSLGVASCPLNANLPLLKLIELKSKLSIPKSYTVIMFIAIGNYKPVNICPVSYRAPIDFKLKHL